MPHDAAGKHGVQPVLLVVCADSPSQVWAMVAEPVDVEDQHAMLELISQHADNIRAAVPKRFENVLAAHRRDVIRYRNVRRGDVRSSTRRYRIGACVYCAQPPLNTLDVR
jgi:hypothetical protein